MSDFSASDRNHMVRALALAERGACTTAPNPRVGCVIARDEQVLGEGWHVRAGEPHAEVLALRAAGDEARGATAYVNLEPCAHHGRTPPCAEALIAAGVARVVAAVRDPNPLVAGRGFAMLESAGIRVGNGLMETEARDLNRGFLSRIERGRPWLRVKLAMSLDGRTALASGESKWISSEAARHDVARWRARSDALLTGAGTVRADDPQLTVRLAEPVDFVAPLRVVVGGSEPLPVSANIFDGAAPTLLLHASGSAAVHGAAAETMIMPAIDGRLDLPAAMAQLAQRRINEVQVEAGATLSGALLRAGLVDELLIYVAPVVLGDRGRPLFAGLDIATMAERLAFDLIETKSIGPDLRLLLRPRNRDLPCSPD